MYTYRSTYLKPLALAFAVLLLVAATGCSTGIIDQISSLHGQSTEVLRDWVRNDPSRNKLVIFVHGFNSDKESAWGQFPTLLTSDDQFEDFNIHRFGYPTKLCRQVTDIRNQGEFLASFLTTTLKSTKPKYRQVVLVGHSMGGLVILEALLKLERDHLQLLKGQDLKILTFGTPYLGVKNTGALLLFCENNQVSDITALNDTLGKLSREWAQRFNQKSWPGGEDTLQVPLYAFRGTEDRFITATSACGYLYQIPCESVDGDHNSIVKPTTRDHLSYQKLKLIISETNHEAVTEPQNVEAYTSVLLECQYGNLPMQMPLEGRIYVVELLSQEFGGGFAEHFGPPGSPKVWPVLGADRCQLTNYGSKVVFNVELALNLTFLEALSVGEKPQAKQSGPAKSSRQWPMQVTKIGIGTNESFVFYIINKTSEFVRVTLPHVATLKRAGENTKRIIRLVLPNDGNSEMTIPPSSQLKTKKCT